MKANSQKQRCLALRYDSHRKIKSTLEREARYPFAFTDNST